MDRLQQDQINIYLHHLRDEPDAYSIYGMLDALLFTSVDIHWGLLRHLQTMWDLYLRAYRMGDVFMCPTIEDFSGILMSTGQTHAILRAPLDGLSPFHYLSHYIGLDPGQADSIMVQGSLYVQ